MEIEIYLMWNSCTIGFQNVAEIQFRIQNACTDILFLQVVRDSKCISSPENGTFYSLLNRNLEKKKKGKGFPYPNSRRGSGG